MLKNSICFLAAMLKNPLFILITLLASAAAACAGETNALPHRLEAHDSVSFRIAEDQVDPQEPVDPKTLTVSDSGGLQVPYIGLFPVEGKTCQQAAEEIKQELEKRYYYKATVLMSLELKAKSVGTCYVSGQVRLTGALEMPNDEVFTLSQAVVRAGGFTDYADKRRVRLTRRSSAGSNSQVVDLSRVIEQGKADKDIVLEPGDSIFVPSRLLSF